MSRAERAADDHRNFRHHGIRNRVHHLRARLDDAAPLGIAAHHKSVHVMEKNQRNQILVAVHDEARRFLRRFGIDHATELDPLVAFVVRSLRVQFLVGDDSHGESANARIAADQRLAIFRLVFVEAAAIEHARQNLFHVVRPRR